MSFKQPSTEELCISLWKKGAVAFGKFKLTSGLESPYYIDLRVVPSHPTLFRNVCNVLAYLATERVGLENFDKVAGIPTTGLIYATAVAVKLNKPLIYVRKQAKKHGMGKLVEGVLSEGERVLIVDDVVTTGSSILRAVQAIRGCGGIINNAVALIDREQGGAERLAREGVKLYTWLKVSEFFGILRRENVIDEERYVELSAYLAKFKGGLGV